METMFVLTKHSANFDIIIRKDEDFGYISKITKKSKKEKTSSMIALKDIEDKISFYLKDGYEICKK